MNFRISVRKISYLTDSIFQVKLSIFRFICLYSIVYWRLTWKSRIIPIDIAQLKIKYLWTRSLSARMYCFFQGAEMQIFLLAHVHRCFFLLSLSYFTFFSLLIFLHALFARDKPSRFDHKRFPRDSYPCAKCKNEAENAAPLGEAIIIT